MSRILGLIILFGAVIWFGSCGSDEMVLPDQWEDIEDYLSDNDMSYTEIDGVYRHIGNADREDYETSEVIAKGDSVSYFYESYTFDDGPSELIWSNKDYIIAAVDTLGGNTELWSNEAVNIKLGTTSLLAGVTKGLEDCRQGDSVVLIMSSDLAYQDKLMGVVDPNTPIMYILNIQTVKK